MYSAAAWNASRLRAVRFSVLVSLYQQTACDLLFGSAQGLLCTRSSVPMTAVHPFPRSHAMHPSEFPETAQPALEEPSPTFIQKLLDPKSLQILMALAADSWRSEWCSGWP